MASGKPAHLLGRRSPSVEARRDGLPATGRPRRGQGKRGRGLPPRSGGAGESALARTRARGRSSEEGEGVPRARRSEGAESPTVQGGGQPLRGRTRPRQKAERQRCKSENNIEQKTLKNRVLRTAGAERSENAAVKCEPRSGSKDYGERHCAERSVQRAEARSLLHSSKDNTGELLAFTQERHGIDSIRPFIASIRQIVLNLQERLFGSIQAQFRLGSVVGLSRLVGLQSRRNLLNLISYSKGGIFGVLRV